MSQKPGFIRTGKPGQAIDPIRFQVGLRVLVHGPLRRRVGRRLPRVDVETFDPGSVGRGKEMDRLTGEGAARIQDETNPARGEHPLHAPILGQEDTDVTGGQFSLRPSNESPIQEVDTPLLQVVQGPRRRHLEPVRSLRDGELELFLDPEQAPPDLVAERSAVPGKPLHSEAETFLDGHHVAGQIRLQTIRFDLGSIRELDPDPARDLDSLVLEPVDRFVSRNSLGGVSVRPEVGQFDAVKTMNLRHRLDAGPGLHPVDRFPFLVLRMLKIGALLLHLGREEPFPNHRRSELPAAKKAPHDGRRGRQQNQ